MAVLGRAIGIGEPAGVVGLIRDAAQAYQPGTGEEARADTAVELLVAGQPLNGTGQA